jgi:hypothetical protein
MQGRENRIAQSTETSKGDDVSLGKPKFSLDIVHLKRSPNRWNGVWISPVTNQILSDTCKRMNTQLAV